ncbi:uncharacterized protein L201_004465 [Kwoniella dendrophila CBS 6074]|uniref:Uncharacterized protein n=1 Tax=Kwoniella dendrophila CBS 6074 TaxID=1295534 RepID=A0AAX4JWA3_9TREE
MEQTTNTDLYLSSLEKAVNVTKSIVSQWNAYQRHGAALEASGCSVLKQSKPSRSNNLDYFELGQDKNSALSSRNTNNSMSSLPVDFIEREAELLRSLMNATKVYDEFESVNSGNLYNKDIPTPSIPSYAVNTSKVNDKWNEWRIQTENTKKVLEIAEASLRYRAYKCANDQGISQAMFDSTHQH